MQPRDSGLPASPAPWSPGFNTDNKGPKFGQQARWVWGVGEFEPVQQLAGADRANSMWRVTVRGHQIKMNLVYGTSANRNLMGLLAPLILYIPGAFDLYAQPEGVQGKTAEAIVTVTQVSNAGVACARRIVSGGPGLVLHEDAIRYVALADSVVSIHGGTVVVPVPALSSVALVAGSTLTSGTGYEEFEL